MFNENTFRALDWLLDEARLHGLRVVLSFIDNWKYPGWWRAPGGTYTTCSHMSSIVMHCINLMLTMGRQFAEVRRWPMQAVWMSMWTGA